MIMHPEMQLTTAVLALAMLLVTIELVRRNRLLEDYCILWLALGVLMLVLAFCPQALSLLARLTGVRYEPSAVFIGVLVLCFSLIMHFSVAVSRLNRQVTKLTQTVALLSVSGDVITPGASAQITGDGQRARGHDGGV